MTREREPMRLVVAAVIVDDLQRPRQLLAARRSTPPALAGRWEFPGGKVEDDEAPEAALARELEEELQVSVRLGDELVGPVDGCWPISAGYRMRTWLAQVTDGQPVLTGSHGEVRWVGPDELAGLDWLDADRGIVAELSLRLWSADLGRRLG